MNISLTDLPHICMYTVNRDTNNDVSAHLSFLQFQFWEHNLKHSIFLYCGPVEMSQQILLDTSVVTDYVMNQDAH